MLTDHTLTERPSHPATVMRQGVWLLWHAIRLPMLALLMSVAPVVRLALRSLALLGVLMSLFFKFLDSPHFPFLGMLAISIGFMLALMAYEALIRVLSD